MSGERNFFAVKNDILNTEMNEAIVHIIKGHSLEFCSIETFCPDFHSMNVESYGNPIKTPAKSPEVIKGVKLLPKLSWMEEFLFKTFLIHLSFDFMCGLLFFLKVYNDVLKIMASLLFSGLLSPTVTQLIAFVYRFVVKKYYNSKCSPMKVESNQSSNFWLIFRFLYLLTTFLLALLFSFLAILLIDEDLKLDFVSTERDAEILIVLLVFTLIVIYTIWLPIFAIIRYVFRSINSKPKMVFPDIEALTDRPTDSMSNKTKIKTPESPKEKSADNSGIESSERSESVRSKIKSKSPAMKTTKTKEVSETDKYSEMTKTNQLNTGSVIVRPTKSLGFIDPKVFKLSESRLDLTKTQSKDNSDKKN